MPRVGQAIKSYLGYDPESTTNVVEYLSGRDTQYVRLRRVRPVTNIDTVHLDEDGYYGQGSNAFASGDLLTEGSDYYLRLDDNVDSTRSASGILVRISNVWTRGEGNIKVQYDGGYSTLPEDIVLAATILTASYVTKVQNAASGSGPVTSERLGDYSVTYGAIVAEGRTDWPVSVVALLRPYKDMVVG